MSDEIADIQKITGRCSEMMAVFDVDRSGGISFLEFFKAIYNHPELLCTTCSMRSYFDNADENSDGILSRDEVEAMMRRIMSTSGRPISSDLSAEVDRIFSFCDDNKDGLIDYPEFTKYFIRSNAADSCVVPFF